MKLDPRELARAVILECEEHPSHAEQAIDAALELLTRDGQKSAIRVFPRLLRKAQRLYGKQQFVKTDVPARLTESEKKNLDGVLEKALKKHVSIEEHVDPSLLGGARIRVGDERFDATLRGALNRFSDLLLPSSQS